MENNEKDSGNEPLKDSNQLNDDVNFENADVDPGFLGHQDDNILEGEEDKRDHDLDANISIKEMREGKTDDEDDALNYKNDRENGAYNPKNI